jgi:topoisomerase-4 subunit A
MEERAELDDLLSDEGLQWDRIASELREVRKTFGGRSEGGARRTQFAEAGDVEEVPLEAMIDREPVTIVCSADGLDPRHEGPYRPRPGAEVRDGDRALRLPCRNHRQAAARRLAGRFYTLSAASLPGGRGLGEPVRLMVDLPNEAEIVDLFVHRPARAA